MHRLSVLARAVTTRVIKNNDYRFAKAFFPWTKWLVFELAQGIVGDEENEARHWQEGSNSTWMIILASVYSTVAIIVDADLGYCIKEWAEMCFYIPAISPWPIWEHAWLCKAVTTKQTCRHYRASKPCSKGPWRERDMEWTRGLGDWRPLWVENKGICPYNLLDVFSFLLNDVEFIILLCTGSFSFRITNRILDYRDCYFISY